MQYFIFLIPMNILFALILSSIEGSVVTLSTSNPTSDLDFFDYLYYSFITFYGIGYGDIVPIVSTSKIFCIIEGAVGAITSFGFAGLFAYRLIKPKNPILFSKNITINTDEKQVQFRFRVDYPKDVYLYDVVARIRFISDQDLVSGHKHSPSFEHTVKFPQIRGVWYVDLPYSHNHKNKKPGDDFIKEVTIMKEKENPETFIEFSVKGMSDEGKVMFKIIRYKLDHICDGYSFVSVRRSEYNPKGYSADHKEKYKLNNFNCTKECVNQPIGL